MALNRKKVENFIKEEIAKSKSYYPNGVLDIKYLAVNYDSFGSCYIIISNDYDQKEVYGLYRYKDVEMAICKWINNCYTRFLQNYYYDTQKIGIKNLNILYDNHLKYNNSFLISKNKDLIIYFISCDEFIITSPYRGTVAVGVRSWNEKEQRAIYTIEKKSNYYTNATCAKICQNYEANKLEITAEIAIIWRGQDEQ